MSMNPAQARLLDIFIHILSYEVQKVEQLSGTVIVKSNTIGKRMIHVVHLKTDQCMNPQRLDL
jgi:hypothetical protein